MQASKTIIKTSLNHSYNAFTATLDDKQGKRKDKDKKRQYDRSGRDFKRKYDFD
jgi:hypothetical protein